MSVRRFFGLAALPALVLLAPPALAQTGSITGSVTEAAAGQPVNGARVQAVSPGGTAVAATLSRSDGTYRLTGLAAGTYTVRAIRIGFAPGQVPNVVVTDGGTATANVQLTEAVAELNPVVTVASRREEKALEAPASVSVVEVREIQERPSATIADHVQGIAGVDVNKGGIAQSNIVARGFNNAFSGSILTLQDYRFAAVPSLRVNVPFLFTATNEDIERVEVLLGPASALYGPNSSHGVLHVITKSPFTSQGTTLTLDGGTRSFLRGSLRHAGVLADQVGYKLSGEYFRADDFASYSARDPQGNVIERYDPGEPDVFPAAAPPGRAGTPNARDFGLERFVGEARLDFRPTENSEYVTTYGLSRIENGLEYTGANGTALARNWTYQSLQQRMRIGRFFAQGFLNFSDAGNDDSLSLDGTYLLRSGQPIVDQSRVFAVQAQHGFAVGSRQDFIYGLDYIFTNPRTGNTINGRNEEIDDVREIGGYVQSTTNITPQWDFIAALRLDNNDQIEGNAFSPRAAVVYKPSETQNFRLTYNRAFATPANFTMFLDLIQSRNVLGSPYNVRALGNPPKQGWSFRRDCDASVSGGLCMRSLFAGQPDQWVPASAAAGYQGVIAANATALAAGLAPQIQSAFPTLPSQVVQGVATQLIGFLGSLQPTDAQVGTVIRYLPPGSPALAPGDVRDIAPLEASFNNTWEIGYKGIIGERFRLAVDAWTEKRGDVGNPAGLATPNVFWDNASVSAFMTQALIPAITGTLMGPPFNLPQQQAAATAQVFAPQVADGIVNSPLSLLPLGIVQFNNNQFASATDIHATYTSYDKTITVNGLDLAADFLVNSNWTIAGTYSWVSDLVFPEIVSSNQTALMLNSPDNKASLTATYRNELGGWGFDVRGRYTNAYPVNSGVYASDVQFPRPGTNEFYIYEGVHTATILDLGFNWRLPFGANEMLFSLRADNLFNHGYRTMPGAPLIGRMVVSRLSYTF
ncbi:MAG TPA: TonB-dependent receptor [Gemmatimonadaceae bacterium]|nr:TonB-dependent receptor [Gemmatimonadaceae bacterium]